MGLAIGVQASLEVRQRFFVIYRAIWSRKCKRTMEEPNPVTFDTLLGAFYSSGRFSEVENLWSLMEEKKVIPDLRCYNSRLHGMVKEKRLSEAVDVFKELELKGLKPNNYTYNLVMKGFVDEGTLDDVKRCLLA
ncbi:hypothetical protein Salat_0211000 [Sesamum alatum]|uniref:Pentatricopeptide repeat-containing protein n=1 Tax=Sesamum alatum TaxID=300844 RepID=A0AAE1YYF4_9LAMI|nr:hypothetical protein Salat_0211000 [Sesamum alatum]